MDFLGDFTVLGSSPRFLYNCYTSWLNRFGLFQPNTCKCLSTWKNAAHPLHVAEGSSKYDPLIGIFKASLFSLPHMLHFHFHENLLTPRCVCVQAAGRTAPSPLCA